MTQNAATASFDLKKSTKNELQSANNEKSQKISHLNNKNSTNAKFSHNDADLANFTENSSQNLAKIKTLNLAQIPRQTPKNPHFKIIINDSGSFDKTHEILLGLKAKFNELEIISDTPKEHGAKLIALYKFAINCGAKWIFQTDSDNQTNPLEFEAFWKEREKFDVILGYRKVRGDGAWRKFVERVVCVLLFVFFGTKIKDANAPFRLMKARILGKYLHIFKPNFNIPNIILSAFFVANERVKFIEISFKARNAGKNSINFWRIFKIGLKATKDFWAFRRILRDENAF